MLVSVKTAELFISGDEEAISQVYQAYRPLLFFILGSYVGNKEDAEDLFQDTFERAIACRSNIKSPEGLHYYLCATAKNLALNFRKKNDRTSYSDDLSFFPSEDREDNKFLTDLCPYLSNQELVVVTYKLVYGFTLKEISLLTKSPISSLSWNYKRALKKIKVRIKEK